VGDPITRTTLKEPLGNRAEKFAERTKKRISIRIQKKAKPLKKSARRDVREGERRGREEKVPRGGAKAAKWAFLKKPGKGGGDELKTANKAELAREGLAP